jgi:putative Mg2+ transporter-C (MgtC) family protein
MLSEFLTYVDVKFLISIIFVLGAGFLIGYERGSRGEPAGVRTHTLVCLGAMMFTLLSVNADPTAPGRIAANIVTGIGFLGAGIIMQHKGSVHGLTTSATLWFAAAVGMAIGFSYYFVAIIGTLFAFIVLKLPHIGEHHEALKIDNAPLPPEKSVRNQAVKRKKK